MVDCLRSPLVATASLFLNLPKISWLAAALRAVTMLVLEGCLLPLSPAADAARPPGRPLVVSAATDNYPYSYQDASGRLAGFAVDVFDAVAPLVSVTLTVKLVAKRLTFGVPVIAPVDVLKLKPVGRLGDTP